MNRQRRPAVLFLTVVLFASIPAFAPAGPGAEALVPANNAFAFDLYGEICGGEENLILSPWSVSVALAMAYAGARGETAAEMERVLRFAPFGQDVHGRFEELRNMIGEAGPDGGVTLSEANALWVNVGLPVLPAYFQTVKTHYDAEPRDADFQSAPDEARNEINRWAEEKTGGMIPELIAPGLIDPTTDLVLANAIHFRGEWTVPFNERYTKPKPFRTSTGKSVDVPTMFGEFQCGYYTDDTMQIAEIPYGNGRFSMVILLPHRDQKLSSLEGTLATVAGRARLDDLDERSVRVFLPRFRFSSNLELSGALAHMGMPSAFTSDADFSGITVERDLWIDWVAHAASIDLNEEGTEAAAATAIALKYGERQRTFFRADRPFLFLIRETETGAILFLGRVTDPSA